jgi:hypothetical protein
VLTGCRYFLFVLIAGSFFTLGFGFPIDKSLASSDRELIVPDQYSTLQNAVDAINGSGTIRIRIQHFIGQQTVIRNKDITIIGDIDGSSRPYFENLRSVPYTWKVEGKSNVTVQNMGFIGGGKAIEVAGFEGQYPNLNLINVRTRLALRGIGGELDNLNIHNSTFSENEGSGVVITRFLNVETTGVNYFNRNVNYGLFLRGGQSSFHSENRLNLNAIQADFNKSGGVWIDQFRGDGKLIDVSARQNMGSNLTISNSSFIEVQNGSFGRYDWYSPNAYGDAVRIDQSTVLLNDIHAQFAQGYNLTVTGCADLQPSAQVEVIESTFVRSASGNWGSGISPGCANPVWNFINQGPNGEEIFSGGFEVESPYQSGNNTCVNQYYQTVPCVVQQYDRTPQNPPFQ